MSGRHEAPMRDTAASDALAASPGRTACPGHATPEAPSPRRAPAIVALVVGFCFALGQAGVNYTWTSSRSSAVLPLLGFVACVAFVAAMARREERVAAHPERAWLVAAIVLGIAYSAVLPVGANPDDSYHYVHCYAASDILLGNSWGGTKLEARACDRELMRTEDTEGMLGDYQFAASQGSAFVSGDDARIVTVDLRQDMGMWQYLESSGSWLQAMLPSNNWPQVRAPAVLGITLARIVGLNASLTYQLGELLSLAYFAALVFFAIRITPVGKSAFMAASLLPMTLSLAASYSYDSGLLGLAFLLTAFCLKGIYEEGPISRGTVAAIAVLTALLVPVKSLYILTALLALATPKERFALRRQRAIALCAVLVGILVMVGLTQLPRLASMTSGTSPSPGGEMHYSLSWMLAHPVSSALLFVRTLGMCLGIWISMMMTGPLGSLQQTLSMPQGLTYGFFVLLTYSCLAHARDEMVPTFSRRMLMGAIGFLTLGAVMLSLCLGWTEVGSPVILGVQGRYLLPVLPIVLLALRPATFRVEGEALAANHAFMCLSAAAVLNAVCVSCAYAGVLMG